MYKEHSLVYRLAEELLIPSSEGLVRTIKKDSYNSKASICFRSEKPLSKIL